MLSNMLKQQEKQDLVEEEVYVPWEGRLASMRFDPTKYVEIFLPNSHGDTHRVIEKAEMKIGDNWEPYPTALSIKGDRIVGRDSYAWLAVWCDDHAEYHTEPSYPKILSIFERELARHEIAVEKLDRS